MVNENFEEVFGSEEERAEDAKDDLNESLRLLLATREEYKAMSKQTKALKKNLDAQQEAVINELKNRSIKTLKSSDLGHRFTVVEKREFKSDSDSKVKYCMENGYENLLDVYYNAWNSHWKKLLEEEEIQELPEFVNETKKETLSVAKSK